MVPAPFSYLSPPLVQNAIEEMFQLKLGGLITPFNSYINRVYGLVDEDGHRYAAKFYRPGRWTYEALADEHDFLEDCAEDEIPVALPLVDPYGETLGEVEIEGPDENLSFFFCLFPLQGGRNFDADHEEDWVRLGRLLGRIHRTGARFSADHRPRLHPGKTGLSHLKTLLKGNQIVPELVNEFEDLCRTALEKMTGLFDEFPVQRIHGDCHRGNILNRPGQGLFLMDFDDMVMGPAVQDLWLLLPGESDACPREKALLAEGYEEHHFFDPRSWALVEPLRFLRMLHFLAWQSHQSSDGGFTQNFPHWGSKGFWIKELEDLRTQALRF